MMHERQRDGGRSPFAGHSFWWWASAAICAVVVLGTLVLVTI